MTMSTGMRVLLTIYLIVIICCSLFLLATMFRLIPSTSLEGVFATAIRGGFWYKFAYAAICVVMIVVSFILMFFGMRKGAHHEPTISIAQLNDGDIVITTRAVEEMVQRQVISTQGVRAARTKVTSYGDYVDVDVHLSAIPGHDIPEMTKELQAQLQDDLLRQTGVKLRDIRITVTDVTETIPKKNKNTPRVV